ncbi:intraflagellar transport protein 122 homolog [Paramacrobiotus metropolitanus]|uniref:intraflagellar transport protein 122 homolog n=1 Tax=Paramacrobiotus metropolitanus TaxID=2943436 RepID=UPI002445985D|nr:intraflagellar transport protein 122 homolog [Paramacrobiotus metropolitanus]
MIITPVAASQELTKDARNKQEQVAIMRLRRLWEERFHPTEKGWGVFDIALNMDKNILLIAAFEKGFYRFRLDQTTGAITEKVQIKEKSGHRGFVIKVSWQNSGKRFATCGTDQLLIIWKDDYTVEKQIRIAEVPQCIAWNPKPQHAHLLCAAASELISVNLPRDPLFYRMQSTIWSIAWNNAGEIYALGLDNGAVSLRDRRDAEICIIHRSAHPVWYLCWAPTDSPRSGLLTVADWNRTISFYEATGKQRGQDYNIGFLPLYLTYSADGQIMYVCGGDKKVHALSTECAYIGKVADLRSWPLKCIQRRQEASKADFLVVCGDGMLNLVETVYQKCSHIHYATYASREALVNVLIRGLERNREVTIPVQDSIRKIAVYRNMLAVAVSDAVLVFRQNPHEMMLKYESLARIEQTIDCNQMLLAAQHLVLVNATSFQTLTFTGHIEQTWMTGEEIRYIKVIGGRPGGEMVLLTLQNGNIAKSMLNVPFLHVIVKVPTVPVCADLNQNLSKLAVVGENSVLYVYDMESKRLLYQEPSADSCAWNLNHPDMIAYSMHSLLKIKLGEHKAHTRRMEAPLNGMVVGYAGSKVFYETDGKIVVVDVPHAMLIHQSMEAKNFKDAYDIACFGVSESDWKMLGARALENLEFAVAKNCVRRERNYPLLMLIDEIEQRSKVGDGNADLYRGEIFAFQGRFDDAARCFSAGGRSELAVKLFTDLRQFAQAEQWATTEEQRKALLEMRADWAVKADNKRDAVELFLQLGDVGRALETMKDLGWGKRIWDTARTLDSISQRDLIATAANYLRDMNDVMSAVELYERIKEISVIVEIMLKQGDWTYLLSLADRQPFYREMILMPYGQHLIEHDRFTEAQSVFARAGHPEVATAILSELVTIAIDIRRYSDAAFYNWLCGRNAETAAENDDKKSKEAEKFCDLADIYYAYAIVDAAVEDPFSTHPVETIFNCSRILAARLWNAEVMPKGILLANVLYVLSVWATKMDANKTARISLERLRDLRLPKTLYGKFTETFVHNRVQPFQDPENLSDYCHSCSSFSPLLNTRNGYHCQSCGNALTYCQVSFEYLPLVEFVLAPGISQTEAITLIAADPSSVQVSSPSLRRQQDNMTNFQVERKTSDGQEEFFAEWKRTGPIVASRKVLQQLKEEDVVVLKYSSPRMWRFFRNMLSDVARVVTCESCWKLFSYDDYFSAVLDLGCCPFCRDVKHVNNAEKGYN